MEPFFEYRRISREYILFQNLYENIADEYISKSIDSTYHLIWIFILKDYDNL